MHSSTFFISSNTLISLYYVGLQQFDFQFKYDCIWLQWVLCYLTDQDLLDFLLKCKENLNDPAHSMIFVKENVSSGGFNVDKDDNSVMRSDAHFEEIFELAGLEVLKHTYQKGFPKELYKISIYALKVKKAE